VRGWLFVLACTCPACALKRRLTQACPPCCVHPQLLLQEFTPHTLQMMVALLEACGRYLYLTPDTNDRCTRFLDAVLRFKSAKASDAFSRDMLDSACYAIKPPDRAVVRQVRVFVHARVGEGLRVHGFAGCARRAWCKYD
jgi:hypothetical protein